MKKKDDKNSSRPWLVGRLNSRSQSSRLELRRQKQPSPKTQNFSPARMLLVLSIAVFLLTWIPVVRVNCKPQTDLDECLHNNIYKEIVDSKMSFLDRFTPFIEENEIRLALEGEGRVDSVEINRTWYNFLFINITERVAHALWQTASNDDQQYVLDKNGVVMALASTAEGNLAGIPHIIDAIALEPIVGEPLVESKVILYSNQIIQDDLLSGYTLDSVEINDSPREFRANFRSTDGSKSQVIILFTTDRPLEYQILDAKISIDYLKEKGSNFRYIDVRLASTTPWR